MTSDECKTIMEMVRMIIQESEDKEEALKKIDDNIKRQHRKERVTLRKQAFT